MTNQKGDAGGDRRKARTSVERTALCVLRADLPRLRTALDTYSRCLAEVMTELSEKDDRMTRRLDLLGSLRRDHDTALADLERIVGLLEVGGLSGPDAADAEDDRRELGRSTDLVSAHRRGWRDRVMHRCDPLERKRSFVEG